MDVGQSPGNRLVEWRGRLVLLLVSLLVCTLLAEVAARTFWLAHRGVPFSEPGHILYAFYPELEDVDRQGPAQDDGFLDILLLGGSALHPDWGHVGQEIREQLAFDGFRNVRLFNLATPGHTSRDSRLKYAAMGEARFDLVVFYHGINEARANNAPPHVFREDYAHYYWYRIVNALAPYHGSASVALPHTLHWLGVRLQDLFVAHRLVPMNNPRKDWLSHGRESLSAVPFRKNLEAIRDRAGRRGERLLLMTFATHVPHDYSKEALEEKRLDYGLHLFPLEIWGTPEHVVDTVAVHNGVVRSVAADGPDNILFVDQARLLDGKPRYFNDPCHLTAAGSAEFARSILEVFVPTQRQP